MLQVLRKLAPLLSMTLVTAGCGKKISEGKTQPASSIENQELPATYIVQLNGSQSSKQDYFLPRNTLFQLPERLKVRTGSTTKKVVDILYDIDPDDNNIFDFKCTYSPSSNPAEMILTYCENDNGNDFYDTTSYFPLKQGQVIQIRFSGAQSSDLIVEAIYQMKWK